MPDRTALEAQINADPRVQQLALQRQKERNNGLLGAMPGIVTPDELRAMGYEVPHDWKFISQNMRGRQNAGLVHSDKWDYIIPAAVGALVGGTAIAGGFASAGAGASAVPTTINAAGVPVNMAPAATAGITPLGGLSAAEAARRAAEVAKKQGIGGNGGGGLVDTLTSPKSLAGLAGLIATLATRPGGGGGGSTDDLLKQNPQLADMLNMSVTRAQRTDPLHQAITQLAMNRLPTNVQK